MKTSAGILKVGMNGAGNNAGPAEAEPELLSHMVTEL